MHKCLRQSCFKRKSESSLACTNNKIRAWIENRMNVESAKKKLNAIGSSPFQNNSENETMPSQMHSTHYLVYIQRFQHKQIHTRARGSSNYTSILFALASNNLLHSNVNILFHFIIMCVYDRALEFYSIFTTFDVCFRDIVADHVLARSFVSLKLPRHKITTTKSEKKCVL